MVEGRGEGELKGTKGDQGGLRGTKGNQRELVKLEGKSEGEGKLKGTKGKGKGKWKERQREMHGTKDNYKELKIPQIPFRNVSIYSKNTNNLLEVHLNEASRLRK